MDYCVLEQIDNPFIHYYIYMDYYDIDITPIFIDKTTYFHWLPNDLINIIKSYDLYDIKEGDKLYKYNSYFKIVEIIINCSGNPDIFLSADWFKYKRIKQSFENGDTKIYRQRQRQPLCNII